MNKLESIGHDVSIIILKIDSQALDLKHAMERIRQDNLLPDLIAASEKYEKYVSGSGVTSVSQSHVEAFFCFFTTCDSYPDHYAGLLADDYRNDDIQTKVTLLR